MDRDRTSLYLGLLAFVAVGAILYFARSVILPLLLAVFLTAMIGPILRALQRRLPLWLSLVVVLLGLAAIVVGGSALFAMSSMQIVRKGPEYADIFQRRLEELLASFGREDVKISWEQVGLGKGAGFALAFLGAGLESVANAVGQAVIVLILTIFIAFEANQFEKKVGIGFGSDTARKIVESFTAIAAEIQRYVMTKTFLSLLVGLCNYVVCVIVGIDFPIFWGVLAFLLNFIPNIGSTVAIVPPVLLAFVQFGTPTRPLATLGTLIVLQNLIGNVLEPKLLSRSMKLSALVVFLSMIFWGWLWGITGVVLSVPLTVAVKIVCGHVEALKPVAVLLGGAPSEKSEQALG